MTLARLTIAWLAVAVWFLIAPPIGYRVDPLPGGGGAGKGFLVWAYSRRAVTGRLVEAVLVTLFASLWFDSLGSGGWWLLFLLVGLLVAVPVRWHYLATAPEVTRREVVLGTLDAARYLGAGALLALGLG